MCLHALCFWTFSTFKWKCHPWWSEAQNLHVVKWMEAAVSAPAPAPVLVQFGSWFLGVCSSLSQTWAIFEASDKVGGLGSSPDKGTLQVWGCGEQELIRAANWWGEAGLFPGFKELLTHLICDRKLILAGMYQRQEKALEGEAQEEKPVAEQESSRPKIRDVEHRNTDLTVICQQLNDPFQILIQPFLQRGSAERHDPIQTAGAEPCGFLHSCMKTAICLIWLSSFYSHRTILLLSRVQHSEEPLLSFAALECLLHMEVRECEKWQEQWFGQKAGGRGERLEELWVLANCSFQNQQWWCSVA